MDRLSPHSTAQLAGYDVAMPLLGYGMSHNGGYNEAALVASLRDGCRLLDTAARYGTEAHIPAAVRAAGVDYDDVFVTTKLWCGDIASPEAALRKSLTNLQRDSVNLYLVHWPGMSAGTHRGASEERIQLWREMERLHDAGLAGAIGVSNFLEPHLKELQCPEVSRLPAVNQIEVNPWQHQTGLVAACKEMGVVVEGYSPLAKGEKLGDPGLCRLAAGVRREGGGVVTPAQVLIRWALQHNFVTIPKSTSPKRSIENRDVFDFSLSEQEMREMDSWHTNLRVTWDPTGVA